jgi:glutamate---cysteine ligase / carboxylate-amine ligase
MVMGQSTTGTPTTTHDKPDITPSGLTIGVEEEFLVVDRSGHLSYQGGDIAGDDTDESEGELARELVRCQVETNTPVCNDASEVLGHLTDLRRRVGASARSRRLRLVPSGTPILSQPGEAEITSNPRYLRMAEWFGGVAHTSNTCGCHVHVAMADRATGVEVINRVRSWLPVLLALTANSPFSAETDTSYHSWRYVMWTRWPSAGPPPLFDSLDHYETSIESMLRAGALLDKGMVYWDIRLSEHHPTLEFRVCDVAATPGEAALVAGLIRGLVATALDDIGGGSRSADPSYPQEVLRANLWRASREGLAGSTLHPVSGQLVPVWKQVGDLVERIRPALREGGDLDLVEAQLATLREIGGAAQRQRTGFESRKRYADVVDLLAFDGDHEDEG